MVDETTISVVGQICARLNEAEESLTQSLEAHALIPEVWRKEIDAELEGLRLAMIDHIALTEADDGLLDCVLEDEPRLAEQIDIILADHGELCEAVDQAQEAIAHGGLTNASLIRWEFSDLLGRLAAHSELAANLVFDAYGVDINEPPSRLPVG